MDKFCRGCLVRYEEPTDLLQYTEKNRRLFVYCTGLQVKRTDSFIFQLCRGCYVNMKVACNFKKQCRNSDKLFKSYQGLRESDENVDLSTFLKNNDDSWTFRFPGSSTPAYQRARDDDNESTTTSIRNFMNDMMPDEFPDTETRIIREVIDEEADVLDDSLDSHWMEDDASINPDFRLDFSFSPFSTPRPVNDDRYTPKKKALIHTEEISPKQISAQKNLDNLDMPKILESPEDLDILHMPLIDEESNHAQVPSIPIKEETHFDETMDSLDVVNEFLNREREHTNDIKSEPVFQCTIDKNLEEALKNADNKEFSLDELLVSPKVMPMPDIKSPATPFINNILFGDKLDLNETSNSSPKYKSLEIETFDNVTGDVELADEYSRNIDIKLEELDLEELKTEMIDEIDTHAQLEDNGNQEKENPFNITNFYCNMCQKKFKSLLALQRHSKLQHQYRIKTHRVLICDYCGKQFNERTNLVRHMERNHLRPPRPKLTCDLCNLEFKTSHTLKQHRRAHAGQAPVLKPSRKKFLCQECGATTDKASNHALHMKRHSKSYSLTCPECHRGFYRRAELTIHMRLHTGEKPFPCPHCDMRFARKDCLTKHIKKHLDLKPFKCVYCKSRFINSTNLRHHIKTSKNCMKDRDTVARNQRKVDENRAEITIVLEEAVVLKS